MGNCLLKFYDKSFTFHAPPLTSGHLKKVVSGIQNNPVKFFASDTHQNHGYEIITESILILWMYTIDFLHNRVRPNSLTKGYQRILYVILKWWHATSSL